MPTLFHQQRWDVVIFDKDGTLIDFSSMWSDWGGQVARCLAQAVSPEFVARLAAEWGFDPQSGLIDANSPLAMAPMSVLRNLALTALIDAGLTPTVAQQVLVQCWQPPDPIALARPLADLPRLFGQLRAAGSRIAVATADDRAPTEATMAALGVAALVDTMVCADDGILLKPQPDAIHVICARLGAVPARTVMIGDTTADLRMGRAAACGLVVGVASGAMEHAVLAPLADVVLPSIAALVREA